MKHLVFLLLVSIFLIGAKPNVDSDDNGSGTCENMASQVYWDLIGAGASGTEAAAAFHVIYINCCFDYPNDCGGIVYL